MNIFKKPDNAVGAAVAVVDSEPESPVVASDENNVTVEATPPTEDDLKLEIKALEKKIANKTAHLAKLENELGEMSDELKALKTQRIELLRRDLES